MNNRLEKLRELMEVFGFDNLLISTPYNLRYITGFTGTTGVALVTKKKQFFISDSRYITQSKAQVKQFIFRQNKGTLFEEVAKIVQEEKLKTLAFEEGVTYEEFLQLQATLPESCVLESYSGLIEELRLIKDESELAYIKNACNIADSAYKHILKFIEPGMTEIQVANELDFFMRSLGASGTSFETIVASGERSAMPHGVASEKVIQQGELVTLDFGCYYKGYVSDMTRTFAIGEIDPQLKEIYEIVHFAQETVNQQVKAGMSVRDYDKLARDIIQEKGYGEFFGHGLGHGIGLEIHEGPVISQKIDDVLKVGEVITNEPGIYLEGLGGVRIEDDLVVTETGCEILTRSPKELIIL